METKVILAIDQGTSATKAILFDSLGRLIHRVNKGHGQFYPKSGWVEHDAEEIYESVLTSSRQVLEEAGIDTGRVAALAITNQRETAVVWDRNTGKPVYHAIVWQCRRGEDICRRLAREGFGETVRERTGLVLSPYFSASKAAWILENVEGARQKADSGDLLFGNMDSWLIWKLTGGKVHSTDYSNASRTQLFNLTDLTWDKALLDLFRIPESMMPSIRASDQIFGYTSEERFPLQNLPVSGILGDSHAALFGQCCFEKGTAKATYGTGSSIMMNIGSSPLLSAKGIVTSLAWGMDDGVNYVFEGNVNCTGDTIKWLKEEAGMISSSSEAGNLAASVDSSEGVYFVPAFVGLSAPYWDSEARASITGMTRGTRKEHIVRAAEESIAYQIKDVLDLMIAESGIGLKGLNVDGGPTRDGFLMQFQADMLDVPVVRNRIEEISALGSAFMAGLCVGLWKDLDEIRSLVTEDVTFQPAMSQEVRDGLYGGWKEAVSRTLSGHGS